MSFFNNSGQLTAAINSTKMIYKPYVNTYDDIATTYSSASEGWTTVTADTGIRYRYSNGQWVAIEVLSPETLKLEVRDSDPSNLDLVEGRIWLMD